MPALSSYAGTLAQAYLELLGTVAICFAVAASLAFVLYVVFIVSECLAITRERKRPSAHVKIAQQVGDPALDSRVLALAGDPRARR